jgi:hypothetical protein
MFDEERERLTPKPLDEKEDGHLLIIHEQGPGGIRWGAEMLKPIAVRNATEQSHVFLSGYHISLPADESGSDVIRG